MRRLFVLFALAFTLPAAAQENLPELEPVPEPPPAVALDAQALTERGVTIQAGEQAEEFEVAGKTVIRVTRPNGTVYYLIQQEGTTAAAPTGDASNATISVPQWLLFQW